MPKTLVSLALCGLLAAPVLAQSAPPRNQIASIDGTPRAAYISAGSGPSGLAPFSRVAFGGGVSTTGINLEAATNVTRHLNVRSTGSFFNYQDSNISTNGFNVAAKLNLSSARLSLDYFPFANHGLRISPGLLVHNGNELSATMTAEGGTSFTLNDVTYYSSPSNPVEGVAGVGLHRNKVSPALTIGWGNMIPRRGGHFSFPVELGAAYTGEPALNMALTSGQVCADPQGTVNCQNVVGNADVNSNLQAQIAKDRRSLSPLQIYPIFSFGVGYSFGVR